MFCGPAWMRRRRSATLSSRAAALVGDLERAEAALADVQRLERVLALALPALQMTDSHWNPFRSIAVPLCDEPGLATHLSGIGTFRA